MAGGISQPQRRQQERLGRRAEKVCGPPAPGGRNQGFPAAPLFFFDHTLFPNNEGDGGDFDLPRREEETRGRQSEASGENLSTETRSPSARGDGICEWEARCTLAKIERKKKEKRQRRKKGGSSGWCAKEKNIIQTRKRRERRRRRNERRKEEGKDGVWGNGFFESSL